MLSEKEAFLLEDSVFSDLHIDDVTKDEGDLIVGSMVDTRRYGG